MSRGRFTTSVVGDSETGATQTARRRGSIGYVLKGYPRLSELFIASEIRRLERIGLRLRLYVIKQPDEAVRHSIVSEIDAKPEYLPPAGSVSSMALGPWLAQNFGAFAPSLRRMLARAPQRVLQAAALAGVQAIRARRGLRPRKVYAKEWLQAVALADRLCDAPDVTHLHAHFCHGATTVTWLASVMTDLPFSFTAHAKDLYCPSLNPAGLLRRKIAAARFVVTCTEANRRYLQPLANGTPVHRVYHGLNAELARLLAGKTDVRGAGGAMLRVLGVGRLVRKKGFDVLVEALALLAARDVHWCAQIVGEDGEAAADLRQRIAERSIGHRIRLAGPLSQTALYDEYRRADILCLPCRVDEDGDRDGIPNVLIEAMACGVPTVTTPVSGIPEVIEDGVTGLIVPVDDAAATADAIERLRRDRALADRIATNAAALVRERFDGDRLAADLARLFDEAVA
jgi:glycosyltransferase involved in cell wall biosynthesis